MNSRSQAELLPSLTWDLIWILLSSGPDRSVIPQTFNHLVLPLEGGTLTGLALKGLPALHCPRWNLGLCLEHPWRVESFMPWPFSGSLSSL